MTESSTLHLLYEACAVLVGLTLGSFWNVCIARLPQRRSLWPRSACPTCGQAILWYDNLPVISWCVLGRRCRACATPIAATYPLIEVLGGLTGWLMYRRLIPNAETLDLAHLTAWWVYMAFAGCLIVATYSDIRHRIIPDETSLYAIPFALAATGLLDVVGFQEWPAPGWRQGLWGAAFGGGFLGTVGLMARYVYGPDALGMGDIKLVAMIGGFVGALPGMLMVLLLASLLGAAGGLASMLILRRRVYSPFAPALAFASLAYVLYGDLWVPRLLPGLASYFIH